MVKVITYIVIPFAALVCWFFVYKAKVSDYDTNYAYITYSFILSFLNTAIALYYLKKVRRPDYRPLKPILIMALILSSPVSILIFIKVVAMINGGFFKL